MPDCLHEKPRISHQFQLHWTPGCLRDLPRTHTSSAKIRLNAWLSSWEARVTHQYLLHWMPGCLHGSSHQFSAISLDVSEPTSLDARLSCDLPRTDTSSAQFSLNDQNLLHWTPGYLRGSSHQFSEWVQWHYGVTKDEAIAAIYFCSARQPNSVARPTKVWPLNRRPTLHPLTNFDGP